MYANLTRGLSLLGLLLATSATIQANDIVDFLNAINGNSGRRSAPVATQPVQRGYGQGQAFNEGEDHFGEREHRHATSKAGQRFHRPSVGTVNLRSSHAVPARSHNGLQANLRFASNAKSNQGYEPPLYIPEQPVQQPQVQQLPPVQGYPTVAPAAFELGEFIGGHCHVPLATCVEVEDECNIAPNAIPVVVAVRDPCMCAHETQERLVFVQIFVPPCPLQNLRVSRCRTRMSLDYGEYQVDIKSVNGIIVVDYDN